MGQPADGTTSTSTTTSSNNKEGSSSSTTDDDGVAMSMSKSMVHLIVLVHGIMGNHMELDYVKQALEKEASALQLELQLEWNDSDSSSSTNKTKVVVHSASANDNNTLDGIAPGGLRIAQEINGLLETLGSDGGSEGGGASSSSGPTELHVSIWGNSLGGLYARYALAHIDWDPKNNTNDKNTTTIHPRLFCTTATPHLGTQDFTYIQLPRSMEWFGAKKMKQTGQDLFRYTTPDLIERLCLDEDYLEPLRRFQKRRVYANAFGTDACVPTATAAFLADMDSSHTVVSRTDTNDTTNTNTNTNTNPCYPTVRLTTPRSSQRQEPPSPPAGDNNNNNSQQQQEDITTTMKEQQPQKNTTTLESQARSLDALGWTKIFVDVRSHIPAVPSLWNWNRTRAPPLDYPEHLQPGTTVTSRDLNQALSKSNKTKDNQILALPFGHSFLVANAKNPLYQWFYSGGQPLVDRIANDLIREILVVEEEDPTTTTTTATTTSSSSSEL
jgi:hypothetical protein